MTNIVMLVHNRYNLTKQALESLVAHTKRDAYTLTIVDDESDDFRVPRLCSRHEWCAGGGPAFVRVSNSFHVLSQLKNMGAMWSDQYWGRGDWLYLSDNDVYFTPDWLPKLTELAMETEIDAFRLWGGQAHPFHAPIKNFGDNMTEHDCLAGTSWLLRWTMWDEFNGLNKTTAPGVCQSEDIEFTNRLRAFGGRIGVINPHVVIDTGITQTNGQPSPGADLKPRLPGILYE